MRETEGENERDRGREDEPSLICFHDGTTNLFSPRFRIGFHGFSFLWNI